VSELARGDEARVRGVKLRAGAGLVAGTIVFVGALVLYVPTLQPDVGTWDTAEFQAVGPVLGIAHPTGYPTYTLLAWLASVVLQPFGNEAFRANLLSSLLLAGAAALLAVRAVQATRRLALGLLAGAAFALTPIAWGLSTRADAHALHAFFAALLLVVLAAWHRREVSSDPGAGRWLVLAAGLYGLALGNHALTLLLAPGIAAYVLLVAPAILRRWRLVATCLVTTLLVTVVVYAYLPLRSAMDPPLDYADPETWDAFWYVVLGQQFQGSFSPPALSTLLSTVWDTLVRSFGLLAVFIPAGVLAGLWRHPRLTVMTGLWFAATWLFALGYPNAAIERYYAVPLLVSALWLAFALEIGWELVRSAIGSLGGRRSPRLVRAITNSLAGLLGLLLLATLVAPLPDRRRSVDASGDTFGRVWLEAALGALDEDAAVVSWWSFSTPLWYGRWVEGRRDDIVIIDDRDVLDEGFGSAEGAIDHYLGERPVYVIRIDRDLEALKSRYELEPVPAVPAPGSLYRVLGAAPDPILRTDGTRQGD
jgi:hypothetical protein